MLAISKQKAGTGASVIDAPMPKVGPEDVLIKVKATSICGTDIHIYGWDRWASKRIKPPLIFGHEFGGEVVEVGPHVRHINVGDHVSAETHIPCLGCYQCKTGDMHLCENLSIIGVDRDGCFAEYVSLPEICCIKNDESLPWDIASIQEPLGNAVYCLSEAGVSGKSVAIFGDGPIGIFAAAAAKAFGAMKVIVVGMQKYRLDLIGNYDVDMILNVDGKDAAKEILNFTGGEKVDVVLEMSGSEKALHEAFKVVRRAGTFVAFGIPSKPVTMDIAEEVVFKGIRLIGISGRKMFRTWIEVASLLASKRIDFSKVITHRFPLKDIDEAMELLMSKEIKAGKIVLETGN